MPNNQVPYDTSFAYAYKWTEPEQDLDKALLILTIQIDEQHDGAGCPAGKEDYWQIESLLASNPNTPSPVLDHISQCSQCPKVLERVAENPNVSLDTLNKLAQSEHTEVRSAVAENLNADTETMSRLVHDPHIDVRFSLAENPNLPMDVLEELCTDENPYVAYRAQVTRTKLGGAASVESLPATERTQAVRRVG